LASIKNLQGFHYKYPLSCRFIKAHSSYIIRIYIRYRLFKGRLNNMIDCQLNRLTILHSVYENCSHHSRATSPYKKLKPRLHQNIGSRLAGNEFRNI